VKGCSEDEVENVMPARRACPSLSTSGKCSMQKSGSGFLTRGKILPAGYKDLDLGCGLTNLPDTLSSIICHPIRRREGQDQVRSPNVVDLPSHRYSVRSEKERGRLVASTLGVDEPRPNKSFKLVAAVN
jgi:hypothetical protein